MVTLSTPFSAESGNPETNCMSESNVRPCDPIDPTFTGRSIVNAEFSHVKVYGEQAWPYRICSKALLDELFCLGRAFEWC